MSAPPLDDSLFALGLVGAASAPASAWTPPAKMPDLRGVKRLSIDTEKRDENIRKLGPGVYRGDSYIVGLSLGTDDGRRWYLPVRHEGGDNMDPSLVLRWARDELDAFDGELFGAHLVYDLESLAEEWGVTFPHVRAYHDVQVAEPLLDEHRGSYALDALSRDYLGVGKDEGHLREVCAGFGWRTDAEVKGNLWRLPAGHVGPYAEGDADRPLRIFPLQHRRMEKEDLLRVYDIERRQIPVLVAMRRRGVRVDEGKLAAFREHLVVERAKYLAEVRRWAGPGAELMAADSLAPALERRGFSLPRTTPKAGKPASGGRVSITKGWLKGHKDDPLVAAIIAGRRVDKILGTYVDGLARFLVKGRIHAEFHQSKGDFEGFGDDDDEEGGGTPARYSSSKVNLQNQPSPSRDPEYGAQMRAVYLPEDGEVWERNDYSQVEFRWLVNFAVGRGAEDARRKYRDDPDTDFHVYAGDIFGADANDKMQRTRIKNSNFLKANGGGYKRLAQTFGCDEEDAKRASDEYDRKLPFVKETVRHERIHAERFGYVTTVSGRRRRFPYWSPKYGAGGREKDYDEACRRWGKDNIGRYDANAGISGKIQGSAADLMKEALAAAREAGVCDVLGAFLVTVHDETGTSVPRTAAGEEASAELRRIMETCMEALVPFRVETERGPSWGECK